MYLPRNLFNTYTQLCLSRSTSSDLSSCPQASMTFVGYLNLSCFVSRLPRVPSVYSHQGGHKWQHHGTYLARQLQPWYCLRNLNALVTGVLLPTTSSPGQGSRRRPGKRAWSPAHLTWGSWLFVLLRGHATLSQRDWDHSLRINPRRNLLVLASTPPNEK